MKVRTRIRFTKPATKLFWPNPSLIQADLGKESGSCTTSEALIQSVGHKWPPKDGRDHGGPFLVQKTLSRYRGAIFDQTFTLAGLPYRAKGMITAAPKTSLSYKSCPVPSSDSSLDALGTTAVARALPTNPISGLAQFIGEAHELPKMFDPKEWHHQLKYFKSLPAKTFASKFLEFEFGWLPLISDIKSFFHASNNLNKIALQYERDSGRNIRRGRKINSLSSSVVTITPNYYGWPAMITQAYQSSGTLYTTTSTFIDTWFKGCFTYYLPPCKKPGIIGEYNHYEAITNKLFGQRVTAETVWNLTPWSWAADWMSNAGDVIHNWQAFQRDGLIMRYGYVMQTQRIIEQRVLKDLVLKDGTPINDTTIFQYETKSRRPATPYGFGLNPNSFSARQNAIIAALAIQHFK